MAAKKKAAPKMTPAPKVVDYDDLIDYESGEAEVAAAPTRRVVRGVRAAQPVEKAGPGEDIVIYRPGQFDPSFVKMNGVEFRANIPVRLKRTVCVVAPIREDRELVDGSVVCKSPERRIPMATILSDNPCFEVNGKLPPKRADLGERPPIDGSTYKAWALKWIARAETRFELDARWDAEQNMRAKCGVNEIDLQFIVPVLEAQRDHLEGRHQTMHVVGLSSGY